MAEATEELVKIYLEQKGYLVTTSKKVNVRTTKSSPRTELDLIAVKTKGKDKDGLPLRILGEVKGFGIHHRCFKKLDKKLRKRDKYKSREEYGRFKAYNNKEYKRKILNELEKEYGYKDFSCVLFCYSVNRNYEQEIREFLKKENIMIITHDEILKCLFEESNNEYNNHPILNTISLTKKNKKKIFSQ